ncbi:hypothetical protein AC249_AIPGENE8795 [Exaiptasia diaphana]|nr:hypothetical protein AC249_AIPGENE8795 [Exaiptasia diaphana]
MHRRLEGVGRRRTTERRQAGRLQHSAQIARLVTLRRRRLPHPVTATRVRVGHAEFQLVAATRGIADRPHLGGRHRVEGVAERNPVAVAVPRLREPPTPRHPTAAKLRARRVSRLRKHRHRAVGKFHPNRGRVDLPQAQKRALGITHRVGDRAAVAPGGVKLAEMELPAQARVAARIGQGQDIAGARGGIDEHLGIHEIPNAGIVDDLESIAEQRTDGVGLAQGNANRQIARAGVDVIDLARFERHMRPSTSGRGHGRVSRLDDQRGRAVRLVGSERRRDKEKDSTESNHPHITHAGLRRGVENRKIFPFTRARAGNLFRTGVCRQTIELIETGIP